MALFKLSMAYEGRSSEDVVEVEAKNSTEARRICEELVTKNRERVEWLTSRNIYDSRMARSCELCPFDFKIDIIAMSEALKSDTLKNDVSDESHPVEIEKYGKYPESMVEKIDEMDRR